MSTSLQADVEGNLQLPSSLLPGAEPLAVYRVQAEDGRIIISREGAPGPRQEPQFAGKTPEERVEDLDAWLREAKTSAGLSDYAVSRDSMYD